MTQEILFKKKNFYTYNRTEKSTSLVYYPKSINEIQHLIKKIFKKKKFLIRTGKCGHGDKSILSSSNLTLSLSRLKKIVKLDKKKGKVTVQSGILLIDLVEYLKRNGFFIYNIPGGKSVSLGGAISANVHGRFSTKKFVNFGDNLLSIKILNQNNKIIKISKNNKLFYKVIGGQSLYGTILEATLLLQKIKTDKYVEESFFLKNKNEFFKFNKKHEKYFGYINIFKKNNFIANTKIIKPLGDFHKISKTNTKIPRDFNIPNFMSFFVNNLSLRILYFYLFTIKEKIFSKKVKIINFEKSIYVSNFINTIPSFFKKGFLEMQFSVSEKNLMNLVKKLKDLFHERRVFPVFFIIKKMHSSKKKYIFNFPKYTFSFSLGFSKKNYYENRDMFRSIYKLIDLYNCNIYVPKDEIFIENFDKKILKKKYLKGFDLKNKSNTSSNFNEKILRKYR